LTPAYNGIENAIDLPNAATMCNQCGVVCPVKIPLPDLMRKLREKQFEKKLKSNMEHWSLRLWAYLALRPKIYSIVTRVMARIGRILGGDSRRIRRMIIVGQDWTKNRDMPAPSGRTFRDIYLNKMNKR
jgi:L-lactate dehydrogenase complex protein LldF